MLEESENLTYEEKRILMLYRHFLQKEYDVNNNKKYEGNNELKNHVEMQNVIYLAYNLLCTDEYGFLWDTYGPKSSGLESNLTVLDKKEESIYSYYSMFDSNIYSHDSIQIAKNYYDSTKIYQLEKFTKLISDILSEKNGIELLADLVFIVSKIHPGATFEVANKELQIKRPIFNDNQLNKFAFRCLENYDLIHSVDNSRGYVKRIK